MYDICNIRVAFDFKAMSTTVQPIINSGRKIKEGTNRHPLRYKSRSKLKILADVISGVGFVHEYE
jgi:hypothetical protein